ncbi:N-acetyltransferase [Pseudenhygromyxa sp. WMMC2535]|uniref:GNAT family N-acetyltransferase n=1 Tax=Pseudenhygromyxa sp. WMMC2535 TaxID=2712867 RepID=UPI0015960584|nr:N-acetyltransferase [Pseudenhygromyxa sp. WMMC2535]NVB38680.1 N-acetyltransferase [Pseudenhygromyxa sp. WMMC2535]
MRDVEIIKVSLRDRKLVKRFIRVPWTIHREFFPQTRWVPPLLMDRQEFLDPDKNPFFDHAEVALWIARKGGRDLGRIAAVKDQAWLDFHGDHTGYFGMFESVDDPAIAGALFDAARRWLEARGLDQMIGPMDLSTNYQCGALIDAFDRDPGMQMPYNPPWYGALIEGQGLEKAKDLIQWGIDLGQPIPPRVVRIAEKIRKREGVRVRAMNFDDWDAEVGRAFEVYNAAWERNWGFVPVSEAEFRFIAKDLKLVLDPSLPLMAEVDGQPVAFALTIMNINPSLKKLDGKLAPFGLLRLLWDLKVRKVVDSGRLILLGIREGYRRRGLDSILFLEMAQRAKALGWWGGEIGWTLEDNHMVNRAIQTFGCDEVAHYRIYQQALTPTTHQRDEAVQGNEGISNADSSCGGEGG